MKIRYCVGADISKATVDFSLLQEGQLLLQQQIENTQLAIRGWIAAIKKQYRAGGKNTLFCLEHTGPYNQPLIQVVSKSSAGLWVETPLQIKHSLGIQRGKNDRLDSLRIAVYAYQKREIYKPWTAEREEIGRLKQMSGLPRRKKGRVPVLLFFSGVLVLGAKPSQKKPAGNLTKAAGKKIQHKLLIV